MLLYARNYNKYCVLGKRNSPLVLFGLDGMCNTKIGITGSNIENEIIATTLPLSPTRLLLQLESTISLSFNTILEIEKESTSLTSMPDFILISNSIQTIVINIKNVNKGIEEEREKSKETYNIVKEELKNNNETGNFDFDIKQLYKYQLIEKMPKIIEFIKIGKNYEIAGKDFILIIKPTNSSSNPISNHVDFSHVKIFSEIIIEFFHFLFFERENFLIIEVF